MIKSLVQAKGLVKHYGERKVVDGVSIQAAEGEIIAIIGRTAQVNRHLWI